MGIRRKAFLCKLGDNTELNTADKWLQKFSKTKFRDNLVSHHLTTGNYALVNNISEQLQTEEESGEIQHEYFFLIVEKKGTIEIDDEESEFVSGYFAKSTRWLHTMVDFEDGNMQDQNLKLKQSGSTPSRFVYLIKSRILYYEYNKNGVSFFDGRFYRYLDTIFGEDTITLDPVMKIESMEQAIQRSHMKKVSLKVAASNVRFVNQLIGLPVPKRFAESLGDENYNITIIVSSNRNSRLGENFITGVWNSYNNFRRKDEIKKLELLSDDDDPLVLTKDLRYKIERTFKTVSIRSKRIDEDDFISKVKTHFKSNHQNILGAIE